MIVKDYVTSSSIYHSALFLKNSKGLFLFNILYCIFSIIIYPQYLLPPCSHQTVVHIHESFFFFYSYFRVYFLYLFFKSLLWHSIAMWCLIPLSFAMSFIDLFPLPFSPLIPPSPQSPHCFPCPWVLFLFCSIPHLLISSSLLVLDLILCWFAQ